MDRVPTSTPMVISTRVTGRMIRNMDKVCTLTRVKDQATMENGRITRKTVTGFISIVTVMFMKVLSQTGSRVEMVILSGVLERATKGIGLMVRCKEDRFMTIEET